MAGSRSQPETLRAVQTHCMAKEGVTEHNPWGPDDIVWKANGKIFAMGGRASGAFTIKATAERQADLILHPAITKAPYVGRYGWVTIRVTDEDTLDIALDLIDESYAMVRTKRRR